MRFLHSFPDRRAESRPAVQNGSPRQDRSGIFPKRIMNCRTPGPETASDPEGSFCRPKAQPNSKEARFSSPKQSRRPALVEAGHIDAFMLQKPALFFDTAGIAGKTSGSSYDTVAGDNNGNGIVPHCSADRLRGKTRFSQFGGYFLRQSSIGCGFPQRDFA